MRHIAFIGLALALTAGLGACAVEEESPAGSTDSTQVVAPVSDEEEAVKGVPGVKVETGISPESLAKRPPVGGSSSGGLSHTLCICEVFSKVDGSCIWLTCYSY